MKISAGILLYRRRPTGLEVLLAHPGGPIFGHKDQWWIPKGEVDDGEALLDAAYREFEEEMGLPAPRTDVIDLGEAPVSRVKIAHIWAIEADFDLTKFTSNTFKLVWPPNSGQLQEYPENDKADWFSLQQAADKLFTTQGIFLERLAEQLGEAYTTPEQQTLL